MAKQAEQKQSKKRDWLLNWVSRHKVSGIKRRWLVNNLSIVVLLLAILFIVAGAAITGYYYDSLYTSLQSRANTSAKSFTNYMSSSLNDFYRNAEQQTLEFTEKDKIEMQVLNSSGHILYSSTGLVAGTVPATTDVNQCIETRDLASFTGYDPLTEERIMAVTAPVFQKGSDTLIGEVRYVTSLKLLDRQIAHIYLLLGGVALAVLVLIFVTNQFFIHSIVNPALKINELAHQIAKGQYRGPARHGFQRRNGRAVQHAEQHVHRDRPDGEAEERLHLLGIPMSCARP